MFEEGVLVELTAALPHDTMEMIGASGAGGCGGGVCVASDVCEAVF